jgi:hypothetical protein
LLTKLLYVCDVAAAGIIGSCHVIKHKSPNISIKNRGVLLPCVSTIAAPAPTVGLQADVIVLKLARYHPHAAKHFAWPC